MRDGDVALGEQRDLCGFDLDDVGAEQLGAEDLLERRHRALAARRDEDVGVRRERPGSGQQVLVLVRALGEMRSDRDPEREAPAVHVERARVRRVGRDADAHEVALRHVRVRPLELPLGHARIGGEDLEVDDRAQPELGGCDCGRARERIVGGRRDPRRERVGDPAPRDREHLVEAELVLARDVRADPRSERLPVAEAGVDRVLEVRVCVDEPREDRRAVEVPLRPARLDRDDPPAVPAHARVAQRRPVDGEDPVG